MIRDKSEFFGMVNNIEIWYNKKQKSGRYSDMAGRTLVSVLKSEQKHGILETTKKFPNTVGMMETTSPNGYQLK